MKPLDHQIVGIEFLAARRRAYLADAPGAGKTLQVIVAARRLGVTRVVVICPAIAREVWRSAWTDNTHLTVLSYDAVASGAYVPPHDLLVLDEAHYLKSVAAKRTKVVLKLAQQAPRVWLLSGTPMPKHIGDLYPMLRAVWPDLLQRYVGAVGHTAFLGHFAVTRPTPFGFKVVGLKNVAALREMLDRIMLRRTDAVLNLPPLHWQNYMLPDLPAMRAELDAAEAALDPTTWDDVLPSGAPLATLRRLLGTIKGKLAAELIDEELRFGLYRKVVVFAYHHHALDELEMALGRTYRVLRVDGESTSNERVRAVAEFQKETDDDRGVVFLGQLTAAGTAITLTAASEVVLVEQAWNPDDNMQAVKRIHRIGQTGSCRARLLFAQSRVDHHVASVLRRKLEQAGEVFTEV